eukprot:scaffold25938_cov66-Phaeocystis_antarctica.AAC.2
MTVHIRRRAGRASIAPCTVGVSAAAAAKSSVAAEKPYTPGTSPASVEAMLSIPNPVITTMKAVHTTRIARASVGKRARRRRQMPSWNGTSHHR